ncbi:MAG: hypothetical protein KKH88_03200 [Nanoarchaeota archaeon]|nr:hypothetical protein [Nanoarchaeota archaeon]MBU1445106.1 hypothetical protein [Nanoarchaeota archaeon]MBU2420361.1 hypothetical protein [Nanoarchaeota archaeon]MBU2474969.1 hypothetical protein [Nanoarchaeota archaeon]MBU3940903.1 hypothetical protein [Nanoarchaeota archaeon]
MIPESELKEIRTYLEKSENPLFFFDDDPDGLCSFLLLRKYLNKGKGIPVKSGFLDEKFLRKVEEYSPDLVIILDKPLVKQEFIDKINVPVLWIDHHPLTELKGLHYYNPLKNDKEDNSPVAYWCYKIAKRKEDMWIAAVGSISDWHIPSFAKQFSEKNPDLLPKNIKDPAKAIFETQLGELTKIFSFILKGKTSDVRTAIGILLKIDNPYEILNQTTSKGKFLYKRIKKIKGMYDELLKKAMSEVTKDDFFVFYIPLRKIAMARDLATEIHYKYPDKAIIIAREKEDTISISVRSAKHNVQKIMEYALREFEKSYGGGHIHACGGNIAKEDWNKFIEKFKEGLKKW